ncbi:MAG: dTDP-4-dehydrorhamnose 3,5-epimerase [Cytophagales bacterium]|nr:dTDP-4-dehydrorhamnose 3,5-epimerase [Cytophagales bacterium]
MTDQFTLVETGIPECVILKPKIFSDDRGRFVKVFFEPFFKKHNMMTCFEEEYYSISKKGTLRGLHFQEPPDDHIKLVTCVFGKILDVVVDLRKNSPTFKRAFGIEIDAQNGEMLYVPKGLAHGFYTMSETAIFLSMNSGKFSAESECGLRWDSIGYDWPTLSPSLSEKDQNLGSLDQYESPF